MMELITEASSSMQQVNSVQDVAAELPKILDLPELTDEPSGHSRLAAGDLIDIHIDKTLTEEIGCLQVQPPVAQHLAIYLKKVRITINPGIISNGPIVSRGLIEFECAFT
jgi:hypothetical protein